MKHLRRAAGATLALLLAAGTSAAQEDARVLPRGYLALRVGGEFAQYDSRLGGQGRLGAPFATPFPASLFPTLTTTRDSLARFFTRTSQAGESFALTADDLFPGTLEAELAADSRSVPISLEAGVAPRLTLRATLPVVRRETELVSLRLTGGALGYNARPDSLARLLQRVDSSLAAIGRLTYVPLAGSRAGEEMQRRFRRATGDSVTVLPLPTSGLGRERLEALLTASSLGALPIASAPETYRLGDVELSAKLQLLGRTTGALSPRETGARLAVEASVRLPTATGLDADSLTEIVTDDGHAGAGGAVFADLPLGSRLWVGAQAHYGVLRPRDVERHTWNPVEPWDSLGEPRTFSREPGDRLEAAVAPTFQVTGQLALAARYGFLSLGETTYEGEPDPGSAPAVFAGLESTAARTLQTLGVGLGYSTLGAFVERRTDIPLELWLTYDTAIAGTAGAPDLGVIRLTGRVWVPAWGGR